MDVGELNIKGSIDDESIINGINRIGNSLSNIENQFNQIDAPAKKVSDSIGGIANNLLLIGTAGVGALIALASKSPVLASTFARIQVSTLQLSNTLGTQFRPVFEGVNSLIQDFNKALFDHGTTVSDVAGSVGNTISDLGLAISGKWDTIKNIIPKTAGVAAGIRLGAPLGLKGMLLGAALGYVAGDLIGNALTPDNSSDYDKYGTFKESLMYADVTGAKTEDLRSQGKLMSAAGVAIGGSAIVGAQVVIDTLQWLFSMMGSKETTVSTATGVPR
jgi:hypothetical protein